MPHIIKPRSCVEFENGQKHCLPSFIIAGVQKGGTSALREYLKLHPWIEYPASSKEIHFFDRLKGTAGIGGEIREGCAPKAHYNCPTRHYIKLFPANAITYDKTPAYIRNFPAIDLIHEWFPTMKLVILLRNPTDRAYSGFCDVLRNDGYRVLTKDEFKSLYGKTMADQMDFGPRYRVILRNSDASTRNRLKKEGKPRFVGGSLLKMYEGEQDCKARDFEDYFRPLVHKRHNVSDFNTLELWRGMYAPQVRNVLEKFGKSQIHFIFQESMLKNTMSTLWHLENFVRVPHFKYPIGDVRKVHSREPMSGTLRAAMDNYFRPYNRELLQTFRDYQVNITSLPQNWPV